MTKYKEYLRNRSIKLDCDMPWMPYHGVQEIKSMAMTDRLRVIYFYATITVYVDVFPDGRRIVY